MTYREYFRTFNENDNEEVIQYVPNSEAEKFLYENAPRLYCPDGIIENTFAFRTWTMRKHIKSTEDGFLLSEFLVNSPLPWAGKHNTINAALTHHLNEFRWLKCSDMLLDYISFFLSGEGSAERSGSAFAYHTPALTAICNFCLLTDNEDFLIKNLPSMEKYFSVWEERHLTENGLYWSIDDREGTEFTISGTTDNLEMLKGFRPLMNSCMYADAISLSKLFLKVGDGEKAKYYSDKAASIKYNMDKKMWDGDFYKAIHPLDQELDKELSFADIPDGQDVRELMGYIPLAFGMSDKEKTACLKYLKDESIFLAKTGFTTADISHKRFLYYDGPCTWCGNVWPYATSYAINAVITTLNDYGQDDLTNEDLYSYIKKYAEMHYSTENGKRINFIDEVMLPYDHVWYARLKRKDRPDPNRGRDYNHSTFIDLVLRGLVGIDPSAEALTVSPRIKGIWKWFRIENLTFKKSTYTVYYDEDGSVFGKGAGVVIEKENQAAITEQ